MTSIPTEGVNTISNSKVSTIIGLSMNKHGLSMNNNNQIPKQALPPLNLKNTSSTAITPPIRKHSLDSKLIYPTTASTTIHIANTNAISPPISSYNSTPFDMDNSVVIQLIPICKTILFISDLLQQSTEQCVLYSNNNNDHISPISSLTHLINQLKRISDALNACISRSLSTNNNSNNNYNLIDHSTSSSPSALLPTLDTLLPLVIHCLDNIKDLCIHIQSLLNIIIQVLDVKHTRHLLLTIHGVTMDMKDTWETILPIISSHPSSLSLLENAYKNNNNISDSSIHNNNNNNNNNNNTNTNNNNKNNNNNNNLQFNSPLHHNHQVRSRSHSDHLSSSSNNLNHHLHFLSVTGSPISSSFNDHHSNSLYLQLKTSVSASSHLIDVLNQSIDSILREKGKENQHLLLNNNGNTLQQKLLDLKQLIEIATKCTNQLNSHLDLIKDLGFEQYASIVQLWEDTNEFSKTFVSLLNMIKLLSMEEDVQWSKAVKQGCLHVTRVTAEVAKLWNNYPMFVQEGYILGKSGDNDSSIPSNTTDTTTQKLKESNI
ncbi:unnamed protein product [Cunninghamella blakesleeana]